MNKKLLYAVIITLIVASSIHPYSAQTAKTAKEYSATTKYYAFGGGLYAFTYSVTMTVQTESQGEWLVGSTYQVIWRISIVDYNPAYINDTGKFYIRFYDPVIKFYEPVLMNSGSLNVTVSETNLTIGQDGLLEAQFTPDKAYNQADIQSSMTESAYFQGQLPTGQWDQNFDIWINIISNTPSPTQQPTIEPSTTPNPPKENLTSVAVIVGAVAAVLVAVGLLAYLVKRKGWK